MGFLRRLKNLFQNNNFIFYILVTLGLASRLFLAIKLPIWHDEFYSIWAATHSVLDIVTSRTDLVHPPGFYLLLHFWGLVSTHLYWYRFLSVLAFGVNIFLIRKLVENLGKPNNPNLLVFLYVFSGYFLVFDWQVRMYTLINTLILSSVLILFKLANKEEKNKRSLWIYFTLINFLGLYIDYAFVWYFAPIAIFTLVYFLLKNKYQFFNAFNAYVVSGILFVVSYPTIFLGGLSGIQGIKWMERYVDPLFSVPFFLGSHICIFFSFVFLALFVYGIYKFIHLKKYNFEVLAIVFPAVFSLIATLLYSHFAAPLFHVRSLQIIGLMVIIFYYFGLASLPKIVKTYLFATFIFWILYNFVIVNQTLFLSPGSVLIDYFPWRDVLNSTDLTDVKTVKYKIVNKLPTQMLLYGLEYTLKGNENIGRFPIKMVEYNPKADNGGCNKFYSRLMVLYKCP